jgi:hypothetical protein
VQLCVESGAIVYRFGSFEILASQNDLVNLKLLILPLNTIFPAITSEESRISLRFLLQLNLQEK